jgi:hypothetical protein
LAWLKFYKNEKKPPELGRSLKVSKLKILGPDWFFKIKKTNSQRPQTNQLLSQK